MSEFRYHQLVLTLGQRAPGVAFLVGVFLEAADDEKNSEIENSAEAGGGSSFSVNGGGTKLSATQNGYKLTAIGTSLGVDGDGVPDAGTITNFEIKDTSTGKIAFTVLLEVPMAAADFVAAVLAGSGDVKAKNYSDAYDLLIPTFVTATGSNKDDAIDGNAGDDFFFGKGGNDTFIMFKGDDQIDGGNGKDTVTAEDITVGIKANLKKGWIKYDGDKADLTSIENITGSKKADTIIGDKKANVLEGGKGNDKLTGDKGKDKFVFAKKDGKDTITDFEDGKDKIDLSAFNFKSKNKALSKFSELGNNHDDKLKFDYKGTEIVVKGIDLGDLSGADIIV